MADKPTDLFSVVDGDSQPKEQEDKPMTTYIFSYLDRNDEVQTRTETGELIMTPAIAAISNGDNYESKVLFAIPLERLLEVELRPALNG